MRFAPGTTIGHFRVVRELGAGGMGVVFEAHDPDLDRRVAIKVVKGGVRSNLLREAQAMARLTHPNVVTVHEVGTIDTQVFVVMELVPGEPPRDDRRDRTARLATTTESRGSCGRWR